MPTTFSSSRRIAPDERATKEELEDLEQDPRPNSRAECAEAERPCPYVSCKYHLFVEVNPETGTMKMVFPEKEIDELEHTCALDVAELDGSTLKRVGEMMNLTRERIRQIEVRGLMKLRGIGTLFGEFVASGLAAAY